MPRSWNNGVKGSTYEVLHHHNNYEREEHWRTVEETEKVSMSVWFASNKGQVELEPRGRDDITWN